MVGIPNYSVPFGEGPPIFHQKGLFILMDFVRFSPSFPLKNSGLAANSGASAHFRNNLRYFLQKITIFSFLRLNYTKYSKNFNTPFE
jgi:hypothetical protein